MCRAEWRNTRDGTVPLGRDSARSGEERGSAMARAPRFARRVIRELPGGIGSSRERKSRAERDSRIYREVGWPIMSISNTTNCTQRSGEARGGSRRVCARTRRRQPRRLHRGLLNSPSKIVLSFQSTRRRYDALRSTSLPYNFQFPRGLPSKGIERTVCSG